MKKSLTEGDMRSGTNHSQSDVKPIAPSPAPRSLDTTEVNELLTAITNLSEAIRELKETIENAKSTHNLYDLADPSFFTHY